jgi:hypothetical protein
VPGRTNPSSYGGSSSGPFKIDDPFVRTDRLLAQVTGHAPSPKLTSKLRRFFFEQRSRALAHLPSWLASMKSASSDQPIAPLVDVTKETLEFATQLHPAIVAEFADALGQVQPGGRVASSVSAESLAREYIKSRRAQLGQVNPSTLATLDQTLRDGLAQNEGLEELAKRVKAVFNAAAVRAEQISQTESAAIFQAASQAGVDPQRKSPAGSAGVSPASR